MSSKSKVIAALLVALGVLVVGVVLVVGSGEDHDIEVRRGASVPSLNALERGDARGEATVQAVLAGGLSCTDAGFDLIEEVSADDSGLPALMRRTCSQAGGTFAEVLFADAQKEPAVGATVARWRLEGDSGNLPIGTILELRRTGGDWTVS